MKTRAEVNDLKADWNQDPCWDLGATEGFEHYREELRAHERSREAREQAARDAREVDLATRLGVPRAAASYILMLEDRIANLAASLDDHAGRTS